VSVKPLRATAAQARVALDQAFDVIRQYVNG